MMDFAIQLAVAFRRGTARGERSMFSSMGISRQELMTEMGALTHRLILEHRRTFEARRANDGTRDSSQVHEAFQVSRIPSDPKQRWVDGTPEYSFGMIGLHKLFPEARFIHIVRDCDEVVGSMLNFTGGYKLAEDENDAYRVWMRYVGACIDAERGLGPEIACHVFHDDLVRNPEALMRQLLDFLSEPYVSACVQPLVKRINSSPPPAAIRANSDRSLDPKLLQEARGFWSMVRTGGTSSGSSSDTAIRLEKAFERRVEYFDLLDARHVEAQQVVERLQRQLDERTASALRLDAELGEARKQLFGLVNRAAVIGQAPRRARFSSAIGSKVKTLLSTLRPWLKGGRETP